MSDKIAIGVGLGVGVASVVIDWVGSLVVAPKGWVRTPPKYGVELTWLKSWELRV